MPVEVAYAMLQQHWILAHQPHAYATGCKWTFALPSFIVVCIGEYTDYKSLRHGPKQMYGVSLSFTLTSLLPPVVANILRAVAQTFQKNLSQNEQHQSLNSGRETCRVHYPIAR